MVPCLLEAQDRLIGFAQIEVWGLKADHMIVSASFVELCHTDPSQGETDPERIGPRTRPWNKGVYTDDVALRKLT